MDVKNNYRYKKTGTVEHDTEKDRNNFLFFLFLIFLYVFVYTNSDKNDWTTISFFSNSLKVIGDFYFIILIVTFIFLYFLSIYIFIQRHCEYKINFSDSDTILKAILIAIPSFFPLFISFTFPLCILFTLSQLIQGFQLFIKYNNIPTSKELSKEEIIINSNTSIDDIFAYEMARERNRKRKEENKKGNKKESKKEKNKNGKKLREFKFENVIENKKYNNQDITILNNKNTNELPDDYEKVEFYLDEDYNNNKAEKIDEKDSIENIKNIVNNDNFENIQIVESDYIKEIDENESIDTSDNSSINQENNIPDIKIVETNDISEIEKIDKTINEKENYNIENKDSNESLTKANNITTKIKPVNISLNQPITTSFDLNIKKPEINKIDLTSKTTEIKQVITNPITSTGKEEPNKETQTPTSITSKPSLLGSIDISSSSLNINNSILGSNSLSSSINIKPLSIESPKKDKQKE